MNTPIPTAQRIALDLAAYRAAVDPTAEFSAWIRLNFFERVRRVETALSRQTNQPKTGRNPAGRTDTMKKNKTMTTTERAALREKALQMLATKDRALRDEAIQLLADERARLREEAMLLIYRPDMFSKAIQIWTDYTDAQKGRQGPPEFYNLGWAELQYIIEYATQVADGGTEDGTGPWPGDNMLRDLAALATRPLSHPELCDLAIWMSHNPESNGAILAAAGRAGFDLSARPWLKSVA